MTASVPAGATRYRVGDELPPIVRRMTRERMRWYADALLGTSEPEPGPMLAGANVHTDDEFARGEGLPGIISDGMISTNWISSVLLATFGRDYLERGQLRTKFIRPILEDQVISARVRVRSVEERDEGVSYGFDVWCEDEGAHMCTVGSAELTVRG